MTDIQLLIKETKTSSEPALAPGNHQIETKPFELRQKISPEGSLLQITEHRPNGSRTVLIPQLALPWLIRVLNDSIVPRTVLTREWRKPGPPKLPADILTNAKGRFLFIKEFLPNQRSYSICIAEDHRSTGWRDFEITLHQHPMVLPQIRSPLSRQTL